MKTRFNTYDIICNVTDLQRLVGMRVNQVYDIDNKAYLIRLQRSEEKIVLLLESANRFHTTQFEWPKNVAPSGFTMKLRKHLKNKRLEKLTQLGIDRIVDFQFGTGEAAYHVILELYDRGNIILTDYNWTILNVLRPHVEGDKVRFAVREQYPLDRAKQRPPPPTAEQLKVILENSKPGDTLKKILNPNLEYGPGIIDHILAENNLSGNMRITKEPDGKGFHIEQDLPKLLKAITLAEEMLDKAFTSAAKGYITQKREERPKTGETDGPTFLMTNVEFHPFLYSQHKTQPYKEFETFDSAIDEFYSTLEGQKIDLKAVVMEREAYKKLQNVKKDHDKRLTELERLQADDRSKADLISHNQALVDNAILAIQSALANQVPWEDIKELVKAAKDNGDPTASSIKHLKLETNHISLLLSDPYSNADDDDDADEDSSTHLKPMIVDIDLALTAYANARRYYDLKRTAAKKQQKTLESKGKALKSAEKKTKQALKEVQTISSINKARKVYWFEKFYWFISSENYLIIGGRDQQQNELLVKRYMKPADVYVHADVSGASSIIIKNPGAGDVPPKTLNEAGLAAVSYSVAWEAKVLTSAWWVHAAQVSKSAPTGEFLSTGSFMIRGKKNYLLPSQLTMGFSFMFRLEESCIERHLNERRVINLNDDLLSEVSEEAAVELEDQEVPISDDDDDDSGTESKPKSMNLDVISEETSNINISRDPILIDTKEGAENSSEEDGPRFPDTHIKVDHDKGKVFTENTQRLSESNADDDIPSFPSLPNRKGKKGNPGSKPDGKAKAKEQEEQQKVGLKRGQRSKLKKIKEKYRHNDEEDLATFLDFLKPDGTSKEKKPLKKNLAVGGKNKARVKIAQPAPQIIHLDESDGEGDGEPELEQESEQPTAVASADTDLLSQLTGCPLPEDELLFAVPVVAPYSALQHYKYKIKLTPGTAKRGKAAKLSLQIFARDKLATQREKDLLKAVKDEDTARNFPGKVKVSTPHLKNIRK